jgi:hypothetical protein
VLVEVSAGCFSREVAGAEGYAAWALGLGWVLWVWGVCSVVALLEGKGTTFRLEIPMTRKVKLNSYESSNIISKTLSDPFIHRLSKSVSISSKESWLNQKRKGSIDQNNPAGTHMSSESLPINSPSTKKASKFLLVDDAPTNRKFLRKLLEQRGHECAEAENGLIAVSMIKAAIQKTTMTQYLWILWCRIWMVLTPLERSVS